VIVFECSGRIEAPATNVPLTALFAVVPPPKNQRRFTMKKLICILSVTGGLFLALVMPTQAWAQETPPSPPPPATTPASSFGSGGAGLGVGATFFLSGLNGVSVVYDMRVWHIEGMFGFNSNTGLGPMNNMTATTLQFGGRGWYHLHTGTNSDFSLGGGVGVATLSGAGASATSTVFEPGMLARVFLTPNFSLHVMAGIQLVFGDNVPGGRATGFGLGSQALGAFGFTYFFR
jgi:hypothetical protein